MQMTERQTQRKWADLFIPEQQKIILKFKNRLDFTRKDKAHVFKYDEREDMERNTDLLIYEYNNLRIALRVRDVKNCKWRDITIRSYNNGCKTEIDKIKEGFGDYMLYCWGMIEKDLPVIQDWILFDLEVFREKHESLILIKDKENRDGTTKFNIYDLKKILLSDCCVANDMPSLIE